MPREELSQSDSRVRVPLRHVGHLKESINEEIWGISEDRYTSMITAHINDSHIK